MTSLHTGRIRFGITLLEDRSFKYNIMNTHNDQNCVNDDENIIYFFI